MRGQSPYSERRFAVGHADGARGRRPARARRAVTIAGVLMLAWLVSLTARADAARAGTVPAGFADSVAISGLTDPTAVRFARDGRVFVAEKSGLIKVFDGVSDPTPTVFAD